VQEQTAKSILVKAKNPAFWFGVEYNANVYRGCTHGCIYCDSRSECYRIDNFENVTAKTNAPELLRGELSKKRSKALIGTGAMSDPYIQAEKSRKLTRQLLEAAAAAGFPVHITTKSDLILRDADLLEQISACSRASVSFTVTTCDEDLASWIEPHAPSPAARLAAMKILAAKGVYTGITLMPVLPFVTDTPDNIMTVARQARLHGARYIIPYFGVTLRDRQRSYYYQKLGQRDPKLVKRYQSVFGNAYDCRSPRERELWRLLKEYCAEYGLVCRMKDFPVHLPDPGPLQLELF
jgi:DNA repair photolyase